MTTTASGACTPAACAAPCPHGAIGELTFTVAVTSGPNAGVGSGSWRISTCGGGIDITAAGVGDMWKASLHGDDSCRIALSPENQRPDSPMVAGGRREAPPELVATDFHAGQRLTFVISVARSALMPVRHEPTGRVVEAADSWDLMTSLHVWTTLPGVVLASDAHVVGAPLALSNGRRVWVTAESEPFVRQRESVRALAVIVEPRPSVTSWGRVPGFLASGLQVTVTHGRIGPCKSGQPR
jgi:hypothetical protein